MRGQLHSLRLLSPAVTCKNRGRVTSIKVTATIYVKIYKTNLISYSLKGMRNIGCVATDYVINYEAKEDWMSEQATSFPALTSTSGGMREQGHHWHQRNSNIVIRGNKQGHFASSFPCKIWEQIRVWTIMVFSNYSCSLSGSSGGDYDWYMGENAKFPRTVPSHVRWMLLNL
jgi:hypothetical protein